MVVCGFVVIPFILDVRLWTYQPGSHRIYLPCFCGACLTFFREKDSAVPFPLVDHEVKFVYPRTNRSTLVGHDFFMRYKYYVKEQKVKPSIHY